MDSLGVGTIRIGRIIAPNCRRHCQEAPKHILAMPVVFLHLLIHFLQREGVWGRIYSSHTLCCGWGGLKDKIHMGGQKPPMCFGTLCASGMNVRSWHRRGVINERITDEKAAGKHFHVLATSLEALSTIRQRCRDMEVLFSGFHVGDAGREVVGGCHGHRFGCLVVSRLRGALEVGVGARTPR